VTRLKTILKGPARRFRFLIVKLMRKRRREGERHCGSSGGGGECKQKNGEDDQGEGKEEEETILRRKEDTKEVLQDRLGIDWREHGGKSKESSNGGVQEMQEQQKGRAILFDKGAHLDVTESRLRF